jgi:hypothetical protein
VILNKTTIDLCSIERVNGYAKSKVEYVKERYVVYTTDPDREKRLAASECVVCYGVGRVGGAALTSRPCGICNKTLHSGNTCVDVLCVECATKNKLCKQCGADIDLKRRPNRKIKC